MSAPRSTRGFSLIAALFLIIAVMLAALAMVATSITRSRSTVLGLGASGAYFAARSGLDIARSQVRLPAPGGGCAAVSATLTIEGYSITTSCAATAVEEAGVTRNVYTLVAVAQRGSLDTDTFVARRVRAVVM